jgi:hypothetical protein
VWLDNIWLSLVSYIHIPRSRCELRGVVARGAAEILDLIILVSALIELIVVTQVGWGELLMFTKLLSLFHLAQARYGSLAAAAIPILISAGVCTDKVGKIRDRWIIQPALFPTSVSCITHHVAYTGGRGLQQRGRGPMMLRVEVYGDR